MDSMSVSGATAGEEPGADMLGSASVGSGHDAESMASRAQLSIKKMEKKARCDVLTGRARVACDRFLLTHHIASRPWAPPQVTAKAKKATAAAMTKEGRAGVWHLVKVGLLFGRCTCV